MDSSKRCRSHICKALWISLHTIHSHKKILQLVEYFKKFFPNFDCTGNWNWMKQKKFTDFRTNFVNWNYSYLSGKWIFIADILITKVFSCCLVKCYKLAIEACSANDRWQLLPSLSHWFSPQFRALKCSFWLIGPFASMKIKQLFTCIIYQLPWQRRRPGYLEGLWNFCMIDEDILIIF